MLVLVDEEHVRFGIAFVVDAEAGDMQVVLVDGLDLVVVGLDGGVAEPVGV